LSAYADKTELLFMENCLVLYPASRPVEIRMPRYIGNVQIALCKC